MSKAQTLTPTEAFERDLKEGEWEPSGADWWEQDKALIMSNKAKREASKATRATRLDG